MYLGSYGITLKGMIPSHAVKRGRRDRYYPIYCLSKAERSSPCVINIQVFLTTLTVFSTLYT